LDELGDLISKTTARNKAALPFLKFGLFGNKRSDKNCLRHNDNLELITGVELDYDAAQMSFDDAVAIAEQARLQALQYTSERYTDQTPRWRILLPTSKPLKPEQRTKLVARVNGLYNGVFSPESFTLSQAFYFGHVNNNPAHRVAVINGDRCIDKCTDLDAGA